MPNPYLPNRRTNRLAYLQDVSAKITAAPATYGLEAGQATVLATKLTQLTTDVSAQTTLRNQAKEMSARILNSDSDVSSCFRLLAVQAMSDPWVSDPDLANLGLSRRKPSHTPRPAPTRPPEFSLWKLDLGLAYFAFRDGGSAGPRSRAANAIGIQVSLVAGSEPAVAGEADTGNIQQMARTYRAVKTLPGRVPHRAYARWITARGLTSPWSDAVAFNAQ